MEGKKKGQSDTITSSAIFIHKSRPMLKFKKANDETQT